MLGLVHFLSGCFLLIVPFTASFDLNTEKELGTCSHASSGFQDGSRHGLLLTVTTGKTLP